MTRVAVIVPARDAAATLPALLDALARQTVLAEVVVVDDNSTDATAAVARAAGVRVVETGTSAGPGAARNHGAAATSAPVLAFTDADCVPTPGWLAAGLHALTDADLVQGRVEPDPAAARRPYDRTVAVPAGGALFETANLFVRRELFDRLGGFGDGIAAPGKHLAEDVYFGWAARRSGARTAFAADALVHHAVFPRRPPEYVAERARLRFFGEIVAAVPELRSAFLHRRVFLNPTSARFDLAVAGLAAAALARRLAPTAAAAPYALEVYRRVRRWPAEPPLTLAATTVAADLVGAAALLAGSVRARSPVL